MEGLQNSFSTQPLRWPRAPCLLVFTALRNLLLTKSIQQHWGNVISMIRLQKIVTSVLLADSHIGFDEVGCHAGKAHGAKNWGRSPDNSQHRNEALSPTVLKQHRKWVWKQIFPHLSLQVRPQPWPTHCCLMRAPDGEDPAHLYLDPAP